MVATQSIEVMKEDLIKRHAPALPVPNDIITDLFNAVIQSPLLAIGVANVFSSYSGYINSMLNNLYYINQDQWNSMLTAAVNDLQSPTAALSEETKKIIETIAVAIGVGGTLLAILVDIIALIAAAIITAGAAIGVAIVLVPLLIIAAIAIGLAAVLTLIAIWL